MDESHPSTPNNEPAPRRSGRLSLSGQKHLLYDAKFHPMDEVTRPSCAAKRRRLHEISSDDEFDDSESDLEAEVESEKNGRSQGKAHSASVASSRIYRPTYRRPAGIRYSARIRTLTPPPYDMTLHPQDEGLSAAGVPVPKRRISTKYSEDQTVASSESDSSDADSPSSTNSEEDCDEQENSCPPLARSGSTISPSYQRSPSAESPSRCLRNDADLDSHSMAPKAPQRSLSQLDEVYQNARLSQVSPEENVAQEEVSEDAEAFNRTMENEVDCLSPSLLPLLDDIGPIDDIPNDDQANQVSAATLLDLLYDGVDEADNAKQTKSSYKLKSEPKSDELPAGNLTARLQSQKNSVAPFGFAKISSSDAASPSLPCSRTIPN